MYDHAPNGSVEMLWLAILWVNKFWHKPGLCRKKSIFPCLASKPWLWHHFITETIHPFKNNVLILIYGWFLMFTKSFIQRLIDVRHDTSFRNQVVKFSIYSRILGIVQSIKAKYIFFYTQPWLIDRQENTVLVTKYFLKHRKSYTNPKLDLKKNYEPWRIQIMYCKDWSNKYIMWEFHDFLNLIILNDNSYCSQ